MIETGQPENDHRNRHWGMSGDAVSGNPATAHGCRLILKTLGQVNSAALVLEIGCGQDEFALMLAEALPQADARGIAMSAEGIEPPVPPAHARKLSADFAQRDLLRKKTLNDDQRGMVSFAACSEFLEHVDQLDVLLRSAGDYLAFGCRLVVTVLGGPRSAFDRHIGHRRHFTVSRLSRLLEESGFEDVSVRRAGFPFFDLYRLEVIARGRRLVAHVEQSKSELGKFTSDTALRFFDCVLRYNLDSSRFGWLLVAVAGRSEPRAS